MLHDSAAAEDSFFLETGGPSGGVEGQLIAMRLTPPSLI